MNPSYIYREREREREARNEPSFTSKWIRPYETIYQRKNRVGLGLVCTSFFLLFVWEMLTLVIRFRRATCTLHISVYGHTNV